MIDALTNDLLCVQTDGTAGAFIVVNDDDLDVVVKALRASGVPHAVVPQAVSVDGRGFESVVNFGRDADVAGIQAVLDAVSDGGAENELE